MKSIKAWLEELPEFYRTEALENMKQQHFDGGRKYGKLKEISIDYALLFAFAWNETPQGGEYWNKLREKLINDLPTHP